MAANILKAELRDSLPHFHTAPEKQVSCSKSQLSAILLYVGCGDAGSEMPEEHSDLGNSASGVCLCIVLQL